MSRGWTTTSRGLSNLCSVVLVLTGVKKGATSSGANISESCDSGAKSRWQTITSGVPQRSILTLMMLNVVTDNLDGVHSPFSASFWMAPDLSRDPQKVVLDRLEKWADSYHVQIAEHGRLVLPQRRGAVHQVEV